LIILLWFDFGSDLMPTLGAKPEPFYVICPMIVTSVLEVALKRNFSVLD
jgi:hypothetical protein